MAHAVYNASLSDRAARQQTTARRRRLANAPKACMSDKTSPDSHLPSSPAAPERAGNLNFILVCVFIDMLGIGLVVPVLPILIGDFVSGKDAQAFWYGIMAAVFGLLQFIFMPRLGATACRILVPGYSEVYPVEDLIWDNTNKSLLFRADILNLHSLDDASLEALLDRLENSELDEYGDIATLIGIEFDENTEWGQLTTLELKLLIHLALQQFEEAKELVETFLQYNDNTVERKLFYQALNVVLEVELDDDLELDDYVLNFRRMYGAARMDAVLGSVDGSVRFFGLTPTSMKLEGLDRHQRLIDSFKKLHAARANWAATAR